MIHDRKIDYMFSKPLNVWLLISIRDYCDVWLALGALGFKSITRLACRIFAELKVIVRTGFLEAKGRLALRILSAGDAFAVGSWTPLAYKKITGVGHIDHIWWKATSGIFNTSIQQFRMLTSILFIWIHFLHLVLNRFRVNCMKICQKRVK